MAVAGELSLRIPWDGKVIGGVAIESTRPQAWRLLAGKTPQQAVQMIPLLYSICGKAQQTAAVAALAAARGDDAMRLDASLARATACEVMREHLWRLLLDWPQLLGLSMAREQFVSWHGTLKAIAAGKENAEALCEQLPQQLLGLSAAEWRSIESYGDLMACCRKGGGLAGPLLLALDRRESELAGAHATCDLLPDWTVNDALQACAGHVDAEFAARPHCDGRPMEAGTLALRQRDPLLQDILRVRPARLLARVVARLADLQDSVEALAHGAEGGRIECAAVADGTGLALVRTARGMLMHYVCIEDDAGTEKVAQYLTIAPTEWNFHPQGALTTGLTGVAAADEEQLMETTRMWVLSLDPCVECRIEVSHA